MYEIEKIFILIIILPFGLNSMLFCRTEANKIIYIQIVYIFTDFSTVNQDSMLFYLLINLFPNQNSKRKRKRSTENEENHSPLIADNVNIADKLA